MPLADLDELLLKCRNSPSRVQIEEAIACYNAGAYRACIVTAWIAVVYDFLFKLNELELTGDADSSQRSQRAWSYTLKTLGHW